MQPNQGIINITGIIGPETVNVHNAAEIGKRNWNRMKDHCQMVFIAHIQQGYIFEYQPEDQNWTPSCF